MNFSKDLSEDYSRHYAVGSEPLAKAWQEVFSVTRSILKDPRMNHWTLGPQVLPFVWHTAMSNDALDGARLPYPNMVLEYNYCAEALGITTPIREGNVEAAKRVTILIEQTRAGVDGFVMAAYAKANPPCSQHHLPSAPAWIPSFYALFISYKALSKIESHFEQINDSEWLIHYDKGGINPFPWLSFGQLAEKEPSTRRNGMLEELGDDLKIVIGLLAILNCSNAPTTTIPAPKFLNRKRKKKGKVLIPEYRTLHVSAPAATTSRVSLSSTAGPRATHWRRGHIRNQPTAKGPIRKWIKPCIIGAGTATPKEVVVT